MIVERIADAKTEAISLAEARAQCRITGTADDDTQRIYIEAARNYVEGVCGNALVESTYAFYFDYSAACYKIYKPIVSITTFEYKIVVNTGTYSGTLSGSDYHMDTEQGLITLNASVMTDIYTQSNAIKITAVTGQANIGNIKGDIKLAMLLLIGHWHENREDSIAGTMISSIPMGVKSLLAPYQAYPL
jgi:uncharacterized phiE125 gp8 family phage protein